MADPTTTRLGIPYPVGTDLISAGPAEMESIANGIDGIYGYDFTDLVQSGVVGNATVLNASGPSVNSSTGVLTVTLNADNCWVSVSGNLFRLTLPTSATNLTPSTLPTSGNYRCVGVYAEQGSAIWNGTATLATAVGTSQTSSANALANPPSAPSNSLLLQYVVLENTSGTYSIAATQDQRIRISNRLHPTSQSANYSALASDYVVMSGSHTVTLPAPTANHVVGVANNPGGTGTTAVATSSGYIRMPNGSTLVTSVNLTAPGSYMTLVGDGSNWQYTGGTAGALIVPNMLDAVSMQTFTSVPSAGSASTLFSYTETGIAFPNGCTQCWVGGAVWYTSTGRSTVYSTAANLFVAAAPNGANVTVTFFNDSGSTLYPDIYLYAYGY